MLSVLEEKLAEAHGLAIAATDLTARVGERLADGALRRELRAMRAEAEETRARCVAADGRPELLAHANTTAEHAADLAGAWFKAGTGPLRAWSFLAMAEAGEVAVWSALAELAADGPVRELVDWALPVQRRHLAVALQGAVRLARLANPDAPRYG